MNSGFPIVSLDCVIKQRKEFIQIDDTQRYKRCRVQLHAQGIVLRDIVTGAEIKTKQQQVCRAGEFLVAEIDAKVGGFGIVPPDLEDGIVSSHYFLFEIKDDLLDRRFLDFYIRTPAFRDQVSAQGSTNYAAIRPNDVLGYTLPLPPLAEQRRIVARIEELAAKIAEARGLRRDAVGETEVIIRNVSGGLVETIAQNVGLQELGAVSTKITDGEHATPRRCESGRYLLSARNVQEGRIDLSHVDYVDDDEFARISKRCNPSVGDVLISCSGSVGKVALVDRSDCYVMVRSVAMIRPDYKVLMPDFLAHVLRSSLLRKQIEQKSRATAQGKGALNGGAPQTH
jgi:type I restriction enzyme S subunit